MSIRLCGLLLFCSALATPVFAGSQTGVITQIVTRTSDGLVFIYMSGAASGRANCAGGTSYWMIKDENSSAGKRLLNMLLAARVTGQPISVVGSGACSRWPDGEDIDIVYL